MSKIDEIKEELKDLEQALTHLENAIDEYESIDWPDGVPTPHHVMMEMEQAYSQMDDRKQEIEDKLERI
jgi:DNA repair exonuclease SbcCD ATPase subunit